MDVSCGRCNHAASETTHGTPHSYNMASPYIPAQDAAFDNWLVNYATLIASTPVAYGLTAGDATAITAVRNGWSSAYASAVNPTTRTSATIAAKDGARASAESTCRPFAIRIRDNAAVSSALKVGLGLTVPNSPPSPIPAPTVAPALALVSAIGLEQTLGYRDPSASGKAKPFGSIGVEVWRTVGTVAATDPAQTGFVGTITKSPFKQTYDAADQGKIVTFFARFVTRSGPGGVAQTGPWSARLALTVM